jgi:NADH-quinone oxidoreductase subunit G
VLRRDDAEAILALADDICTKFNMISGDWNGFNVLHRAASRVGGLNMDFLPGKDGRGTAEILAGCKDGSVEFLYLLGADELPMSELGNTFVVYQGHHGDAGAHRADVILPGSAYTEKDATYVNTEGRVQRTNIAVFAPGEAQEDWKILHDLADELRHTLPYSCLDSLREYITKEVPSMAAEWQPASRKSFGNKGKLSPAIFQKNPTNFYMTDPISRASKTMAACMEAICNQSKDAA